MTAKNTIENNCWLDVLPTDLLSVVTKNLSPRDNGKLLYVCDGVEIALKKFGIHTCGFSC